MRKKIYHDDFGGKTILRDHNLDLNGIAPRGGISLNESAMRIYITDNLNNTKILAGCVQVISATARCFNAC